MSAAMRRCGDAAVGVVTLDSSRLYAGVSWLVLAVVLAIAIAGLRLATRAAYATIRPAKAYLTEP